MHNGLKMVGGSLLAAWLALNPAHALAQEKNEESVSIPTPSIPEPTKEAWMQAGKYALNNPEVAFSVYGRTPDATAKQIGEFMKRLLAARGVPSMYFLAKEDQMGAKVMFFLKDVAYGPTGINGAPKNLNDVARHFSQAWPDYQMPRERPAEQPGSSYR